MESGSGLGFAGRTLERFCFGLNHSRALSFCFNAFSSREPVSTSLENALRWLVATAIFVGGIGLGTSEGRAAELQSLEIITKAGVQVFSVEVMRTDEERAKGLMFRTQLPEGRGMLFDFSPEQNVSMWMKNTLIPLDMIFIQSDGRILRIAENTQTESEAIISSGGPVRGVLEVIAGTAKKFGIKPGDRVAHPLFNGK